MRALMDKLKAEEDILNQEQEDSHEDNENMKTVFQKKIQHYMRYLKEEGLTELERLMISNRKEWQMSHLLSLIIHEETTKKLSDLTERILRLEKANETE